jgi:Acetyltransferase (GNAT) domain
VAPSAPVGSGPTGYLHPLYAESQAPGRVRSLAGSGGHLLLRPIPARGLHDATGPYPLLACRDWSRLGADLDAAGDGLVSLVAVADPFGGFDEPLLAACFPDLLRVFKHHQVADLSLPRESFVAPHHRRNAQKALRAVAVERVSRPADALDDWDGLYRHLRDRHRIEGPAAFEREALERQLQVPGLLAFRAVQGSTTVGMLLFYMQGPVAYYHLGAHSDAGYAVRASFALFWEALRELPALGARWLDLGAGAGTTEEPDDGLGRFKRGWATTTRPAYLCGRIFDHAAYRALVADAAPAAAYFPGYRQPPASPA